MYSLKTKTLLNNLLSYVFGIFLIYFINFMIDRPITIFISDTSATSATSDTTATSYIEDKSVIQMNKNIQTKCFMC
jgi:hypothetical protein